MQLQISEQAITKQRAISKQHRQWWNVNRGISTSNHMFERAICDKLSECIFENFEIARVKRGQFQIFQK